MISLKKRDFLKLQYEQSRAMVGLISHSASTLASSRHSIAPKATYFMSEKVYEKVTFLEKRVFF